MRPLPLLLMIGLMAGAVDHASLRAEPPRTDRTLESVAAEERAIEFLAEEVPKWSRQNHCFSCHNNGDAARALYAAARLGYTVPPASLEETTRWLGAVGRWQDNGGSKEFQDQQLADLQFAFALLTAIETGSVSDRAPLHRAAQRLADHQAADGSWQIDAAGTTGSPATYGNVLATAIARQVLQVSDPQAFQAALERADRWLLAQRPGCVLDAAALLIGISHRKLEGDDELQKHCLDVLARGQAEDGGWGPYVNAQPEPFDTAVAVLALCRLPPTEELTERIRAGRNYLTVNQLDEGSWAETTRPSGDVSYAQRLSTSGWATWALLESRELFRKCEDKQGTRKNSP